MPVKNPRVHAVLERPLYDVVRRLAKRHGRSLSQEAHDLIRQAVELHEDRALDELAEQRRASWDDAQALTGDELLQRLSKR